MDIRRVRGLILGTVLRWVDMVAGAGGAFDQGRVDDGGGGLFQLQAMALAGFANSRTVITEIPGQAFR